jgi:hypothetical protein
MGGDAGLPGRAAPSRGQLCRAIGRDRPKGGAAKITSLPSAIPPASAQVVPSGATVKEGQHRTFAPASLRVHVQVDFTRKRSTQRPRLLEGPVRADPMSLSQRLRELTHEFNEKFDDGTQGSALERGNDYRPWLNG